MTTHREIDQELAFIHDVLRARSAAIALNASFRNSFEGWLKFEVARAYLEAGDEPWCLRDGEWTGSVGVEYRHRSGSSSDAKLIDLWVGNNPTHYLEFKVAFANPNQQKQLLSWRSDFDRLGAIFAQDREVAGIAALLLAVGFDEDAWMKALAAVPDDGRLVHYPAIVSAEPGVRFSALRRQRVA